MDQDSFANDSTALMQWLKETPSARINSKIALEDFRSRGAGRGVGMAAPIQEYHCSICLSADSPAVAIADVAEDEELFTIPRTRVLSVHNSKLQSLLSNELASLGPWLSLMLIMMYEYLHDKDSPWYSYFRVLPRHFDTLIFWNESELAELQGSAVVQKIGKYEAETSILAKLAPIVRNNQILFPPLGWSMLNWNGPEGDEGLLELTHMMGSLIMAYAFDIEEDAGEGDDPDSKEDSLVTDDEDDSPKGMVPLADMLNADGDLNNF
jgi:SET domain-containing protein 6